MSINYERRYSLNITDKDVDNAVKKLFLTEVASSKIAMKRLHQKN